MRCCGVRARGGSRRPTDVNPHRQARSRRPWESDALSVGAATRRSPVQLVPNSPRANISALQSGTRLAAPTSGWCIRAMRQSEGRFALLYQSEEFAIGGDRERHKAGVRRHSASSFGDARSGAGLLPPPGDLERVVASVRVARPCRDHPAVLARSRRDGVGRRTGRARGCRTGRSPVRRHRDRRGGRAASSPSLCRRFSASPLPPPLGPLRRTAGRRPAAT